jgi:hypothetical protein
MIIQKLSGGAAQMIPKFPRICMSGGFFASDKARILPVGQVKFSLRCKG